MDFLHWTVDSGVATATLDRPPVNALSTALLEELDGLLVRAAADPAVRCLVLTGAGTRAFAAGADIHETVATPLDRVGERTALGQRVTRRLEQLTFPVIAAVNGLCLGGGCELAMAADLRLAASTAQFGQPEVRLGIMPGFGGTQRLPRIVGRGRGLELLLTGATIDAAEAHRIGLVNRVCDPGSLASEAAVLARSLAALPAAAVAGIKAAVDEGIAVGLEPALEIEMAHAVAVRRTPDAVEGLAAFAEKRTPRFGRVSGADAEPRR